MPAETVTSTRSIVVAVDPSIPPVVVLPSAWQAIETVAPAATSPGGAWIAVVDTVTAAGAAAGSAMASASDAYTYRRILMASSELQTVSP